MSAPAYQGTAASPEAVARVLADRANLSSSLVLEKGKAVMFCEEIPFSWGPQPTLRQQFYRFVRRANQCRSLFGRLANWEHRKNVEDLFSGF